MKRGRSRENLGGGWLGQLMLLLLPLSHPPLSLAREKSNVLETVSVFGIEP
jgi:hypothetical protein